MDPIDHLRACADRIPAGSPMIYLDAKYAMEAGATRIAALEAAIRPLWEEYEQGQFSDNHPHHRALWEAVGRALIK